MIQRIQSLWLLLAAIVMALLFYFPIYKLEGTAVTIGNNFLAIVLIVLSIALSLVALFYYKKRKNQLALIWLNFLVAIGLLIWLFLSINEVLEASTGTLADNPAPEGYYWIGSFIPLVTIVLLFMARSGIRKDEKLVRSLDRLR